MVGIEKFREYFADYTEQYHLAFGQKNDYNDSRREENWTSPLLFFKEIIIRYNFKIRLISYNN